MKPSVQLDDAAEKRKAYRREHYQKNKEKYKATAVKSKQKAKERRALTGEKAKRYRTPLEAKQNRLKVEYGLLWDDFIDMYESQGGQCKICRTPLVTVPEEGKALACVDHCHDTGKVRGLLCNPCNRGIGYLKDSPTVLRLAAEYLDAHKPNSP